MKIIGHRGARSSGNENTVRSFERALEHHVDEIELDVRVTKDGKTVLLHDRALTDPAGNELAVATHTFAELQQHKPDLNTLEEAITFINRRVPLYIEVKPGVPTAPIITILKHFLKTGWTPQDFRLGSYNQEILLVLHEAFPDIQKIVIENWSSVRAVRRADELNTKRLSMLEYWLWSGFIRAMARRGYELYSFPPKSPQKERLFAHIGLTGQTNNPRKARAWAKHGLAGVITDFPDRFEK